MSESQMSDKTFARVFFTSIALLLVLTLFLIFIAHVNSSEVSARLDEERQKGIDQVVAARVAPVGTVNVGEPPEGEAEDAGGEPMGGEAVYQQACLACHDAGVAGSPKLGDEAAWSDRVAKGEETLYEHAINGFQGEAGVMPPKGGATQLSDDEVRNAVDYMLGAVGHETSRAASDADSAQTAAPDTSASDAAASDTTASASATASSSADGEAIYQQACMACHTTGVAGSPKVGDQAAWSDRIAKGIDMLYDHAINGFQGEAGVMPAKGGQSQLSDDEVRAAVDYMVNASQ